MKTVLVLSQITYIPGNCYPLLMQVLKKHSPEIFGVVFIQNLTPKIIISIFWLAAIGCPQLAKTLLVNIINLVFPARENLVTSYGIKVLKVTSMNDESIVNWVKKENIDCVINVRTRCIYKSEILGASKFGCFNIHHGLLPKYRGMYCDLYALFEKRPAGISFHKMNSKIDSGHLIYTQEISDENDNNYLNYLRRNYKYEAELINKFLNYFLKYHIPPTGRIQTPQNIVYTRTPSRAIIKQMKQSGLQL